jgi:hypothetical protein
MLTQLRQVFKSGGVPAALYQGMALLISAKVISASMLRARPAGLLNLSLY